LGLKVVQPKRKELQVVSVFALSNINFDIDTESVAILLKILQKGVADLDRRPLDILVDY